MERLDGRVAVITGAASGIGLALATRFVEEGMSVVLADVDDQALAAVAKTLTASRGAAILPVVTDVTDGDAVNELARRTVDRFGAVHLVCNNAGVLGQFGTTWETPLYEWNWILDVNLGGVVNGIRAFVPLLLEQTEAHIVNTASAAAWLSVPGIGPYAASKHGVLAVSEALRLELESQRAPVGVSVLCPQFVKTSILTSDRVWPDRRGRSPSSAVRPVPLRDALARGIDRGVPPSAVAAAVVDGIRANRFVISEAGEAIAANADRRAAIARGAPPRVGR